MTQEEKQLLVKALRGYFPYGVICSVVHKKDGRLVEEDMKLSGMFEDGNFYFLDEMGSTYSYKYIPYLRPMSSMTEEEQEDYFNICNEDIKTLTKAMDAPDIIISDRGRTQGYVAHKELEWLYQHHFDFIRKVGDEYKTLTELGLAIEAPDNMYNN